jgi:hypothetical protein
MPKMGSHYSFGHLKHKLWPKEGAGSWIVNLTLDQKKSRINPIYLAADDVPHTVGKLSTRATTLLQITLRSEVFSQSYGDPKSRESQLARFRDSHPGVPGEKSHLDVGPVERCRVYYKGGRWWLPPSPGRGESCVFVLPVARPSTKGVPTMH